MKWSSWSLVNKFPLPACMCVHCSPPLSSAIQDDPCWTVLCSTSISSRDHKGSKGDGVVTSAVGAWPQCSSQTSCRVSLLLLHHDTCPVPCPALPHPGPKCSGTCWGKWSFSPGVYWKLNVLVFGKLKQWFYIGGKIYCLDFLTVLNWWADGSDLLWLCAYWPRELTEGGWTNPGTHPPVFGNA